MKITALDNVTCEDLGLDPHEDAHQTGDLLDELRGLREGTTVVADALRTAWRRGIAFALSGQMPEIPDDWVVGQDRESYTDDQDRESYTVEDPDTWIECEDCGNRYPMSAERWDGVQRCGGCGSDAYFVVPGPRVGRGPNPAHFDPVAQALVEDDDLDDEECYCDEDQGAGYTYHDEHGECGVCLAGPDSPRKRGCPAPLPNQQ